MAFDPLSLLIIKLRCGRGVAVLRDHCADYDVSRPQSLFFYRIAALTVQHHREQGIIAVAQRTLQPLQFISQDASNLTLLASIPGYPDASEVELTSEVWPAVSSVVHSVTIVIETGLPFITCQVISSWTDKPILLSTQKRWSTLSRSAALRLSL